MITICLFYIGEPRYQKETKKNHDLFFKKFKENNLNFNLYDFTSWNRTAINPGISQITNFYNSLKKIKDEQYIIKLRTDIYFPEKYMDLIIKELLLIINGEKDACFFGREFNKESIVHEMENKLFFKTYNIKNKVTDWILICNRDILVKFRIFKKRVVNIKTKTGNLLWLFVLKNNEKSVWINCLIYLFRHPYVRLCNEDNKDNENYEENEIIYYSHFHFQKKSASKWNNLKKRSIPFLNKLYPNGPHSK